MKFEYRSLPQGIGILIVNGERVHGLVSIDLKSVTLTDKPTVRNTVLKYEHICNNHGDINTVEIILD